ncbi:MAG: putative YccA/Bax inhibitor family protein [Glaciecola sp.]|jgi:uncharacterized YccA/Bax inhibitor family protein
MLRDKVLRESRGRAVEGSQAMTIDGTLSKVALLLLVVVGCAAFTWSKLDGGMNLAGANTWMMGGGIAGFVLCLIISFKPTMAPVLAVPFAVCEGLLLGAVSAVYRYAFYDNIVVYAVLLTIGVSFGMFVLWRTGIIQVTDRMRSVVMGAMGGVFLVYLATFLLGFAGIEVPMIHGSGPIGIGFSALVLVIVSFMLTIDFDMIQRMSQGQTPKYMEWYGAFALLVTLVWLYMEMLRLLGKLSNRD